MKKYLPSFGLMSGICVHVMVLAGTASQAASTSLEMDIQRTFALHQPLMWVGDTPPSEQEDQVLLNDIRNIKLSQGMESYVTTFENFIANHAGSPWIPSLQANLGRNYFEHGKYHLAIETWNSAWAATAKYEDGSGKQIADFVFVNLTELLAGLGKVNDLTRLYDQVSGRSFGKGPILRMVNKNRQNYQRMLLGTDSSFRCGLYALNSVGVKMLGTSFNRTMTMKYPASTTGFSLAKLMEIGQKVGVDLVAVAWAEGKPLMVPSVVHWKDEHYAAILAEKDGLYLVDDTLFGRPKWLSKKDIDEEASGYFLIPKKQLSSAWKALNDVEAAQVFGRGPSPKVTDPNDKGKKPDCPCTGMAVWSVSEPNINLWLYDEPLAYQSALGGKVSFKLSYKQRNDNIISHNPTILSKNFFSLGNNWNCSLLSYVEINGSWSSGTMGRCLMQPNGGWSWYVYNNSVDSTNYSKPLFDDGSIMQENYDGTSYSYIISYSNGAKDYYNLVPQETPADTGNPVALLSARVDPYGHTNQFVYIETNYVVVSNSVSVTNNMVLLQYLVDADGKTNTLNYTNVDYPAQITGITDPFERTASLQYDNNGLLASITDTIGMTSSFLYDDQYYITNLTTPYGTTTFETYEATNGVYIADVNNNWIMRSIRVVDPAYGTNVYMLHYQSGSYVAHSPEYEQVQVGDWFPYIFKEDVLPVNPLSSFNTDWYVMYRNSFHWGPKQAVNLPFIITNISNGDYKMARLKHWFHAGPYSGISDGSTETVGQCLEVEREPSPDGITPGQMTWYDYEGKVDNVEGYTSQPSVIARILPDGTTRYTWYQRNQWGNSTNVVDTYSSEYGEAPLTKTNNYVYDSNGINVIQHVSPLGESTGYMYDANNNLLFVTNALNEVTAYSYDTQGRRTSVRLPSGLTTTNIYYASGAGAGFLQTTVDLPINRINTYTYANNLIYSHTDDRGLTTVNTWDALNRLVKIYYPDDTFVTNSYDRLDLVQIKDRMGYTNSFGYDAMRRQVAATNALGRYTLYDYCTCGALDSIQDAAGKFTLFTYDNAGNQLSETHWDADNIIYSITNSYDSLKRVISTMDSGGVGVTNWYNNQGKLYAVDNSAGRVLLLTYDIEDRLINSVDANGVSIGMTYDGLGRLLTRSYPDEGMEKYGYTANITGPTSYTNQITNVVCYSYDAKGRKTNECYLGVTTNWFSFDSAGDLVTLTDGKKQVTTWNYDSYGRVTNKVDAANNILFTYKYDADNRLTNRTSAAKGTNSYGYDSVGNLIRVDYPISHFITLDYDAMKRLTNMVDAAGTTKYSYNALGQLLSEDGPWSGDTVSYTYQNRLRTSFSVNGTAWTNGYCYDLARRLTSVSSPAGIFGYDYDPIRLQRVNSVSLPNGANIANTFDNVARLTRTALMSSSGVNLDSYAYNYNQANQRTSVTRAASDSVNYGYDNIGELVSASGRTPGGAVGRLMEQFGYVYDAAGNLNFRTNNTLVQKFNVNNLNELTSATNGGRLTVSGVTTSPATNVTVNTSNALLYADLTFSSTNQSWTNGNNTFTAVARDGYGHASTNVTTVNMVQTNSAYVYDLNGNLLTDGTRSFAYDDENQLTSVWKTNVWRDDYVYDGKMRRRIVTNSIWNASAWTPTNVTFFVYDGNLVIQERGSNNVVQVNYSRGNDLSGTLQGAGGIGGLLARTDTNGSAFYHADGNGNVTCLIFTNQTIAAKYLYDPFGNTLSQFGLLADANTYRFSSKEWNNTSGLYYYLYRLYDANLQRWLNRDPLGDIGSYVYSFTRVQLLFAPHMPTMADDPAMIVRQFKDPLGAVKEINMNSFLFLVNNSVCSIDPDGNFSLISAGKLLGGIGIALSAYELFHGLLKEGCHAQKKADDARTDKIKKCLANGEDPAVDGTPINNPTDNTGFRNICVSLGLYD